MFRNKSDRKKYYQTLQVRVRHQILREMHNQLEKIHKLREARNLKNLVRYVEVVLGNYYQIKTDKEMPRKNEFVALICQQVGLAHLDLFKLPFDLESIPLKERLQQIFSTLSNEKMDSINYVFGDINTYEDPENSDAPFIEFKRKITYLNNRLSHCTLSIEKCYLYHEMAKQNLRQFQFDEVRTFGRKIIDESKKFEGFNFIWCLLGIFIQIKADIMQNNYVKVMEDLQAARVIVGELENENLAKVIETGFKVYYNLPINIIKYKLCEQYFYS